MSVVHQKLATADDRPTPSIDDGVHDQHIGVIVAERDHLSRLKQSTATDPADPRRREAHCRECGCRITLGLTGDEYGHKSGRKVEYETCSHHIYGGDSPELADR